MTAQNEGKTIRITCRGAALMDLNKIVALQGALKELSEENYERLRGVIIKRGFSFPMGIALIKGKPYGTIDGHQRHRVVKRMVEQEGFTLPGMKLPVCWIECKDKAEAGQKILDAVSQYGKVTDLGLSQFVDDFKLNIEEFNADYDLPDFSLPQFLAEHGDVLAGHKRQDVDGEGLDQGQRKDQNWFYITFYGEDDLFKDITARLTADGCVINGKHEIPKEYFMALLEKLKVKG